MEIKDLHRIQKMVSCARAIISNQVGISVGCLTMSRLIYWTQTEEFDKTAFRTFESFTKATGQIPVGTERLLWNRQALKPFDQKLVAIEVAYREEVLDACFEIIARYAHFKTEEPK